MKPFPREDASGRDAPASGDQLLLTDTRLRRILGAFWVLDGLLQIQPQMFTMNMITGMMAPISQGQPAPIAANLNWWIAFTTRNLIPLNWGIMVLQVAIGLCLLTGHWVKPAAVISLIWALVVWYVGEGLSLLLTGQGSALTGAPGSVMLYFLLTFSFLAEPGTPLHLTRTGMRRALAGFWIFAALLQLQPYWWQPKQISQLVTGFYAPGTISGVVVDPSLHWLAAVSAGTEVPLNLALIVVFATLGIGLFLARRSSLRPWLIASIVVCLLIWWFTQDLGMTLTGMATDPNSGPLLALLALGCWHRRPARETQRASQPDRSRPSTALGPA
jgi:uncharacterized membrane protein YphA (DoxX/SURF4 family)